jgi:tetratricopeptide (TPR) repeat protein
MTALVSAQSQPRVEDRVRDLYAAAEYDQALSLLADSNEPAAQQYRALCFLALGRDADAERALEALISSAPEFVVPADEMPPRFVTLFAQQRREIVPGVLKRLFSEARDDYRAKAYDRAVPQFKKIIALSSDDVVSDLDGVADLRLLASSTSPKRWTHPGPRSPRLLQPRRPRPPVFPCTGAPCRPPSSRKCRRGHHRARYVPRSLVPCASGSDRTAA